MHVVTYDTIIEKDNQLLSHNHGERTENTRNVRKRGKNS